MSTVITSSPAVRTWRDIQQSIAPKAMSSEGRKRLLAGTVKSMAALFALGLGGWGAYEIFNTWERNPMAIKSPVKSEPIKTVETRSDGVLDKAWVTRVLALPKNAGLMDLDLPALQARLMNTGQVRNAVLTRKFPATLVVMIEERWPVVRVHAQLGDAAPKDLLVARDGVIYDGSCYDPAMIGSLPYLADVGLKRMKGQFQLVPGMDKVADLLMTAQVNIPALFRNWSVVSLARFEADGFIIVRSKEIKEIIFGTRDRVGDFHRQIAMLDMIVAEGRIQPENPAVSVNLALGETKGGAQVPVVFGTPIVQPAGTGTNRSAPTRPPLEAPSVRATASRNVLFTSITFPSREL